MTVLVTGAAGFIGRHVVAALAGRGHRVRALVRPGADAGSIAWPEGTEPVAADLSCDEIDAAAAGADAVVHLAARVAGSDEQRFAGTLRPTERVLEAVVRNGVRRLVLASSYSVYDWSLARGALDEHAPLEARLYERDGYAVAKAWQERVVRREADRSGFELVVLRPGFVWGRGAPEVAGAGVPVGPVQLVVGPLARLPVTYVENCADCFADAVERPEAAGGTFNVVDAGGVRAWRFARAHRGSPGAERVRVPVPYVAGLAAARAAEALSRLAFGPGGRLPSLLVPRRFEARFKPLRHSSASARAVLGWRPAVDYDEAVRRCR